MPPMGGTTALDIGFQSSGKGDVEYVSGRELDIAVGGLRGCEGVLPRPPQPGLEKGRKIVREGIGGSLEEVDGDRSASTVALGVGKLVERIRRETATLQLARPYSNTGKRTCEFLLVVSVGGTWGATTSIPRKKKTKGILDGGCEYGMDLDE